jgi:hypothetical protein
LVCENPNCVPKAECCPCALGAPRVAQPFPFFKESEKNTSCCGCAQNKQVASEYPQVMASNPSMFNTMPSSKFVTNGSHTVKVDKSANIQMLKNPVLLGPQQYSASHKPQSEEFERARISLNLNKIHQDRYN